MVKVYPAGQGISSGYPRNLSRPELIGGGRRFWPAVSRLISTRRTSRHGRVSRELVRAELAVIVVTRLTGLHPIKSDSG